LRYIIISAFVFSILFNYTKPAGALECLPTCSSVDGRFLAIAGTGLSTIVDQEIIVNFHSTGDNLEFGIFDGEAGENWDYAPEINSRFHVMYELYADPTGDASGLNGVVIATWTGMEVVGLI